MSAVRIGRPRALRAVAVGVVLTCVLSLTACSNSNRGVTGSVGVGIGVALITPGSVTQLTPGQAITVTASVTNDNGAGGVTWGIQGAGTLSDETTTTALYTAPSVDPNDPSEAIQGLVSATITATSNDNAAYYSQVTLITIGQPVFNEAALFPANVNVGYAASLSVSGGTQPFTWVLDPASQPLPPGITLLGSTTGLDSISGTPTTVGVYPFTVDATDANSVKVTQSFTVTVNPQQTCVLSGSYTLLASGFRGGGGMTHVANISVDSAGAITGEQDYKDGHRTTLHEVLLPTSNCINRQTNSGQITLNSASGSLLYNVSVTVPDPNTNLIRSARIQLIGSGSDSASGLMTLVDPTTIPTTAPSGPFAFGLLGVAYQQPNTVHFATAGSFTADTSGNLTGLIDSNSTRTPLSDAQFTGSLTPPDANGRGLASFVAGGTTFSYVYYMVANVSSVYKFYLMNIDAPVGSPRSSGFMTTQVGSAGLGAFDSSAFSDPSILTLWGAITGLEPVTVQTMGRLSNNVPSSTGTSGTLGGLVDITAQTNNLVAQPIAGQYTLDTTSGRGVLTVVDTLASATSYTLVFYLDGVSNGYVVETGTKDGSGGLLEQQYQPPAGYPVTLPGYFVGGTQFAMAPGPITLTPLASLSFGTLSSNFTNASFYIDTTNGRGFGTLTQSGVGTQSASLYIVSPTKIDVIRFSSRAFDGNVDWLTQN